MMKSKHFIFSLSFHVAIFLLFFIVWGHTEKLILMGEAEGAILQSYLSKEVYAQKPATKNIEEKSADLALKKIEKVIRESQTANLKAASKGENVEALLALLHTKIAAEQHYPLSAEQLEREGRVKVTFMLQPNGAISEVKMAASSGTDSLDEAALSAVKRAAPFPGVNQYLTSAKMFSIDVVFTI